MTLKLFYILCPLCKNGDHKPVRRLNSYRIVCCKKCRFQFVNPRPDEQTLLKAYTLESVKGDLNLASIYQSDKPVESYYTWSSVYTLNRLFWRRASGQFLDIGTGQGWTVRQALKHGYDAYGYEFGNDRAFHKDPQLRKRIYTDTKTIESKDMTFDLLHLSAVLEHVYDPYLFLKYWLKYLKPNGYFMIASVPNMNSIFIKLKIDSWEGNIPLMHLNYFTSSSLKYLLDRLNVEIVDIFTMGVPVSIGFRHIFNQKLYEGSYWGDDCRHWKMVLERMVPPQNKSQLFHKGITAFLNHSLKLFGCGANIYTILKKRE